MNTGPTVGRNYAGAEIHEEIMALRRDMEVRLIAAGVEPRRASWLVHEALSAVFESPVANEEHRLCWRQLPTPD